MSIFHDKKIALSLHQSNGDFIGISRGQVSEIYFEHGVQWAIKYSEDFRVLQSALLKAEAQNKVLREQRDKAIDESWGNPVGAHNEISRLNAEVDNVK